MDDHITSNLALKAKTLFLGEGLQTSYVAVLVIADMST